MRKGFTLLELMVVVIIIGVLATLGVMQYQGAIEKSRGAEARQVLGQLRSQCAAIYMADASGTNCNATNLRVGTESDEIPSACTSTHYFSYGVAGGANGFTGTATRCTSGGDGKSPGASSAGTLTLTTNFANGSDVWSGGY